MQQGASTQELLPCPFCGTAIERIESMARAFQPARLFHEYHHPRGGDCFIRTRLLWSGEAGSDAEAKFLTAWNTRIEHTPSDRNDWFAGDVDCDGNRLVTVRVDELVEVVRHAPDCTSLGGSGDADCTCGAVRFLDRALTTTPEPTEPAGVAGLVDELERVAKALCEVAQENARRDTGDETLVASYGWQDWIPDAKAAIAALSHTPPLLEVAKEALEPFAKAADDIEREYGERPTHQHQFPPLIMRDFTRARAALQAIKGAEQ